MTLHTPNPGLVLKRRILLEDVPFAEGKQLMADVPIDPKGVVGIYINATVCLTVDLPESNSVTRLEGAILLVIHAATSQKYFSEPISREEMATLAKLLAEACAEVTKTILGWNFDFRWLLMSLAKNKFMAWSEAIVKVMNRGEANAKSWNIISEDWSIWEWSFLSSIIP